MLMQDVVSRVPTLSFIDMSDVLVSRGSDEATPRARSPPAIASRFPPSEPGYYFWRDRRTRPASPAARNGSSPSRPGDDRARAR